MYVYVKIDYFVCKIAIKMFTNKGKKRWWGSYKIFIFFHPYAKMI